MGKMLRALSIKKLWGKVVGDKEKGTPCWILSKEGSLIGMCPGKLLINHKDGVLVDYEWLDKTGHSFLTHQDDYICHNPADDRMIFAHNVGDLFSSSCRFDGQIGSEYFHAIKEENR